MIAHQSRTALGVALLLAGVTVGAPVASAAGLRHAPASHQFVWSNAQLRESYMTTALQSSAAQAQMNDRFADLHME